MSNRRFLIFFVAVGVSGAVTGYLLAGLLNLQPYKLVNITGLLFNLLAVFVLSEALISNTNWKRICVERAGWSTFVREAGPLLRFLQGWVPRPYAGEVLISSNQNIRCRRHQCPPVENRDEWGSLFIIYLRRSKPKGGPASPWFVMMLRGSKSTQR